MFLLPTESSSLPAHQLSFSWKCVNVGAAPVGGRRSCRGVNESHGTDGGEAPRRRRLAVSENLWFYRNTDVKMSPHHNNDFMLMWQRCDIINKTSSSRTDVTRSVRPVLMDRTFYFTSQDQIKTQKHIIQKLKKNKK